MVPPVKTPVVWRSYWHDVLHSVKRAVFGRQSVRLLGKTFRVAYEARGLAEESDYVFIAELAKNKTCVFDIGANVGLTSLVLATSAAESAKVFSFEASEAACLTIRENALLNSFGHKIRVINALLAEESGKSVNFDWNFVAGNASVVIDAPSRTPKIPLTKCTLRIDDFVAENFCPPDFVKIDVEGSECNVIAGMTKTLSQSRPVLLVEMHSWPGMALTIHAHKIRDLIGPVGYRVIDVVTGADLTETPSMPWDSGGPIAPHCRRWILLTPEESAENADLRVNVTEPSCQA